MTFRKQNSYHFLGKVIQHGTAELGRTGVLLAFFLIQFDGLLQGNVYSGVFNSVDERIGSELLLAGFFLERVFGMKFFFLEFSSLGSLRNICTEDQVRAFKPSLINYSSNNRIMLN